MTKEETVTVPRWALEYVLDNAGFFDGRTVGGGDWASPEMTRAKDALDAALEKAAKKSDNKEIR
jgi:hypothetical protein